MNRRPPDAPGYVWYRVKLQLRREDWTHLEVWCRELNQTGRELIEAILQQWCLTHPHEPEPPPPTEPRFDPDELVQLRDLEG